METFAGLLESASEFEKKSSRITNLLDTKERDQLLNHHKLKSMALYLAVLEKIGDHKVNVNAFEAFISSKKNQEVVENVDDFNAKEATTPVTENSD